MEPFALAPDCTAYPVVQSSFAGLVSAPIMPMGSHEFNNMDSLRERCFCLWGCWQKTVVGDLISQMENSQRVVRE